MSTATAAYVYSSFKNLFIGSKESKCASLCTTNLPRFEEPVLKNLCDDVTQILKTSENIVHVDPPAYIVGDVNGQFFDLIRIIGKAESFSTHRFVFVGNFIGEKAFSIECLALLFSLFCLCPRNVVLLRGSSENEVAATKLGLNDDLRSFGYSPFVFHAFVDTFQWLPLACIISKRFLVTHGGIGNNLKTLGDITSIERPYRVSYSMSAGSSHAVRNPPCHISHSHSKCSSNVSPQLKINGYPNSVRSNANYHKANNADELESSKTYSEYEIFEGQAKKDKLVPDIGKKMDLIFSSIVDFHGKVDHGIVQKFLKNNNLKQLFHGGIISQNGFTYYANNKVIAVFSQSNVNNKKNKAGYIFLKDNFCMRGRSISKINAPTRETVRLEEFRMEHKERRVTNLHVFQSILKKGTLPSIGRVHSSCHSSSHGHFTNFESTPYQVSEGYHVNRNLKGAQGQIITPASRNCSQAMNLSNMSPPENENITYTYNEFLPTQDDDDDEN